VIAVIGRQFVGALTTTGVSFAFRTALLAGLPATERVVLLVLLYLSVYLILVVGIFRVTGPLHVGLSMLKVILPGPSKPTSDSALSATRK